MDRLIFLLIYLRKKPLIGKVFFLLLKLCGMEIPPEVKIGNNVKFVHNGYGVVIHPNTVIKDNVQIFHGVTIGRADAYLPSSESAMKNIVIEDGAILCAGAKILCKTGTLIIGKNTIIGANAVISKSTGDNEIWAGIPSRKIGDRTI